MNRTRQTPPYLRTALTGVDVIIVVATFAILIVLFMIMLPSMHSPVRGPSVCAKNLRDIGVGMYTYANENNEMWFNCGPGLPESDKPPIPVTYAPGIIGQNRDISDHALIANDTKGQLRMSVTRTLWALVRMKMCTPKGFVCPSSDDDTVNKDSDPENYWDFAKYTEVSYGIQVPFGRFGQPSVDCDQRMPLVADKGPYGAALEAGKPNPGLTTAQPDGTPDSWKPWNSPNHVGDGQNALFADGHVDWDAKPIFGIKNDNIYTRWSTPTADFVSNHDDPLPRIHGTPPTSNETPMSNSDTLIYP